MSRDVLDPHSHRWSTVLMAPQLETFVLKATLEEEGIPCFLPDGHIKTIDPFVSGANALMHAVQVREEHLEKAREILEAVRNESPPIEEEEDRHDLLLQRTEDIGRRIQWATIFVLTHPIVPFLARDYFKRRSYLRVEPQGHRFTMAALLFFTAFWISISVIGLSSVISLATI